MNIQPYRLLCDAGIVATVNQWQQTISTLPAHRLIVGEEPTTAYAVKTLLVLGLSAAQGKSDFTIPPSGDEQLTLRLTSYMWEQIQEFQNIHGISNRGAAIRALLTLGASA